jgi:hypothetical protein
MTSPEDIYGLTIDALQNEIRRYLDDVHEDRRCLYHRDSISGQRRRSAVAWKIRGLRRAIATTRINQWKAREAERVA